jgi:hypothetical protein
MRVTAEVASSSLVVPASFFKVSTFNETGDGALRGPSLALRILAPGFRLRPRPLNALAQGLKWVSVSKRLRSAACRRLVDSGTVDGNDSVSARSRADLAPNLICCDLPNRIRSSLPFATAERASTSSSGNTARAAAASGTPESKCEGPGVSCRFRSLQSILQSVGSFISTLQCLRMPSVSL